MVERAALAAIVAHLVKFTGISLAVMICLMFILWIWWEQLMELERRGLEVRYRGLQESERTPQVYLIHFWIEIISFVTMTIFLPSKRFSFYRA